MEAKQNWSQKNKKNFKKVLTRKNIMIKSLYNLELAELIKLNFT